MRWMLVFVMFWCAQSVEAQAHEFEPSVFRVSEVEAGQYRWYWQPSTLPGNAVTAKISAPCGGQTLTEDRSAEGLLTCQIVDLAVEASGWGTVSPEVLVHLDSKLQSVQTAVLSAGSSRWSPAAVIAETSVDRPLAVAGFLGLGFSHVVAAWDHLAFVFCLMLIARGRMLIWTITAFTLGHSVTLVGSTLGAWRVAMNPVEALIALSIVWMARAVAVERGMAASVPVGKREPLVYAGLFGLLHGLGFASVLGSGREPGDVDLFALVAFNLGVELGQLAVVVLALAPLTLLRRRANAEVGLAFLLGGFGMYCFGVRLWAF